MHTLKILCRHGDITGISEGSIVFTLRCHSTTNAKALWEMYTSGRLQKVIEKGFITPSLKKFCRVRKIRLKVGMVESEYLHCLQELGKKNIPPYAYSCTYPVKGERRWRSILGRLMGMEEKRDCCFCTSFLVPFSSSFLFTWFPVLFLFVCCCWHLRVAKHICTKIDSFFHLISGHVFLCACVYILIDVWESQNHNCDCFLVSHFYANWLCSQISPLSI